MPAKNLVMSGRYTDLDREAEADLTTEPTGSDVEHVEEVEAGKLCAGRRRINWSRRGVFVVSPALALVLAIASAFLKYQDSSVRVAATARTESLQAAKDTTVALLSYKPDTAEKDLGVATERLTGTFKKDYQDLIDKVVIPGSKEQHISTTASVPGAASVSMTADHAVLLLFVNQTTIVGTNPPSDMVSTVRATMDRVDGRWLMSGFQPV